MDNTNSKRVWNIKVDKLSKKSAIEKIKEIIKRYTKKYTKEELEYINKNQEDFWF